MQFLKTFTITLTPKRQLVFGLPILVVVIFFLVAFFVLTSKHNQLKEAAAVFGSHPIIAKGKLLEVDSQLPHKYVFSVATWRHSKKVRYICVAKDPKDVEISVNRHQQRVRQGIEDEIFFFGLLSFIGKDNEWDIKIILTSCGVLNF